MKREHEPMATKPASLKPVVHQKLELDLDEGATRVHKFPKELIHRLREQESAKGSVPPPDDRTAVFRAPPELLARARAKLTGQAGEEPAPSTVNDLPTKPPPAGADDQIADSGVQYLSESTSGISLRPSGIGGFAAVPTGRAALGQALAQEPGEAQVETDAGDGAPEAGWGFPESAIDDPTLIRGDGLALPTFQTLTAQPADESPSISLVDTDPITSALLNTDVDALLAPAAPPAHSYGFAAQEPAVAAPISAPAPEALETPASARPEPRRSLGKGVLLVAVLVAAALAAFVRFGLGQ
jgi:hypothetical protein